MEIEEKIKELSDKIEHELTPLLTKECILLDLPYYFNIGDVLIWEGTETFLKKMDIKCLYRTSAENFRFQKIASDVVILLQGGGNFGDLWRKHQQFRLSIIQTYPDNPIIILPQSICYENESIMKRDALIMQKHNNLTICARDTHSYSLLELYFTQVNRLLLPDMAFCISSYQLVKYKKQSTNKILYLKRNDKELLNQPLIEKQILSIPGIVISDWPSMEKLQMPLFIYSKLQSVNMHLGRDLDLLVDFYFRNIVRKHLIKTGVKFLSRYNYIYTTRLHVAILSILLNKPFAFIDNSYGKNRGFYDTWLNGLENVEFLNFNQRTI
ncbi:polysaccharide pyruvyl transferase family protein [Bacteroides sp. 51]|uniref:polysaccharide pyruvyl transferase family protein n=1 Tax=Bacteroides sp. 51 TaxID=2302938 RepID=UPI0013D11569|nr:polysaccharide pyruvyl transferase family protein [Bacteroides sp. 51]NDV81536.1 polysaccharide pyruvyl transferase YvfF [Bacteroides sp. 51]